MKIEEAFREAEVFSLTRGARFCVYGYPTPSGRWTYTFHARAEQCGTDESTHPARAAADSVYAPVERCHHGYAKDVCGPCYFGDDERARERAEAPLMYDDTVWPEGGVEDIGEAFLLELRAQGMTP